MDIKLLFLDLNGTVIDDWEPSYAGVQAIFVYYNKPCPTIVEYITQAAATGDYYGFYKNNGVSATRNELYEIYSPAYFAHTKDVVVIPCVSYVLKKLKERGVKIHLLTAARRDFAEPLMVLAGIEDFCDDFHYHTHDKSAKIKLVIESVGISPEKCAMIGDLPSDVVHAKKAGIKGIVFLNQHVPKRLFCDCNADFLTDSFLGLLEFVNYYGGDAV